MKSSTQLRLYLLVAGLLFAESGCTSKPTGPKAAGQKAEATDSPEIDKEQFLRSQQLHGRPSNSMGH